MNFKVIPKKCRKLIEKINSNEWSSIFICIDPSDKQLQRSMLDICIKVKKLESLFVSNKFNLNNDYLKIKDILTEKKLGYH